MKAIYTENAPKPIGPYSQAILVNGTLYCSGQIPLDSDGSLIDGNISNQTEKVCQNISTILSAAGLDFENVVKTTCFLTDMNDFTAFNEVYSKYFVSKPARSCVAVKQLPKNALVEIEVIAMA